MIEIGDAQRIPATKKTINFYVPVPLLLPFQVPFVSAFIVKRRTHPLDYYQGHKMPVIRVENGLVAIVRKHDLR